MSDEMKALAAELLAINLNLDAACNHCGKCGQKTNENKDKQNEH